MEGLTIAIFVQFSVLQLFRLSFPFVPLLLCSFMFHWFFFVVTCVDFLSISLCVYAIESFSMVIIACDKLLFFCCFQDSDFVLSFLNLYIHLSSRIWEVWAIVSLNRHSASFSITLPSGTAYVVWLVHKSLRFCSFFFFFFLFCSPASIILWSPAFRVHWFFLLPGHICCGVPPVTFSIQLLFFCLALL